MSNPYSIVTVCTHVPTQPYYCLREYIKSLGKDLDYTKVLDGNYTSYGGLASKPRGVYKAIKEGLINTEYIIFTDCFDFIFAKEPKHFFNKYLDWFPDTPIVFSTEKNCFPADTKEAYDELAIKNRTTSEYKYLNSGMIVGKTEAFYELLKEMDAENMPNDYFDEEKKEQVNPNDQFFYQQQFLKTKIPVRLDYNQILCNCLHSVTVDSLSFQPQGIFNTETGSVPMSFHFNGSSKTDGLMKPILSHLNLL